MMNITQHMLFQSRSAKCFAAMATLTLFCVSAVQANQRNISFGEPGKSGIVTVNIHLTRGGLNGEQCHRSWNASIGNSDTGTIKATKVMAALLPIHSQCGSEPGDEVTYTRVSNVVTATSSANWRISGFWISVDNTRESEAYNVSGTRDRGLVSLAGIADGISGSVTVQVGKGAALVTASVTTSNGQTASAIEDALLTDLGTQGVPARLSAPADRLDLVNAQGDGRAIVILDVDDIAGDDLSIDVNDAGIQLDVGGLLELAGACCNGTTCEEVMLANCAGVFYGTGTACADVQPGGTGSACIIPRACCHEGGCWNALAPGVCEGAGGITYVPGVTCDVVRPLGSTVCIPTLTEWGVIVMTLLVVTAGTVVVIKRRRWAV